MNKTLTKQIQAHAAAEFPRECCGVVIAEGGRQKYVPCRNDASTPSEHFIINPEDLADAEDRGAIRVIVHSHPDTPAQPSMAAITGPALGLSHCGACLRQQVNAKRVLPSKA